MQQNDAKGEGGAAEELPRSLQVLAGLGTLDELVRHIPTVERNLAAARKAHDARRVRSLTQLLTALRRRRAQLDPEAPPEFPALCTTEALREFRARMGCADCAASIPCQVHESLDLVPRCHPKAGLRVSYHFPTNTVQSCCRLCGSPCPTFFVADTIPKDVHHAEIETPADRPRGPQSSAQEGGPLEG